MLRKHARAVVCPAGANIAHTPVSLRSTVAPVRNPATPPYDVKDKRDAKRNRELTQGCGPGMPGPYGVAWTGGGREGRGRAAARPFCSGRRLPVDEWHSKVAGRACPAPTGWRESLCPRGAREGGSPPLLQWASSCPLMGCRGRLRAAYMPPLQSCHSPLRGFGGTPEFKVEEGAGALRTKSNTAFV